LISSFELCDKWSEETDGKFSEVLQGDTCLVKQKHTCFIIVIINLPFISTDHDGEFLGDI